jgi:hypothetical protein
VRGPERPIDILFDLEHARYLTRGRGNRQARSGGASERRRGCTSERPGHL